MLDTMLLERSDYIPRMNQFPLEEARLYLESARGSGRTSEELAVAEVLCEFRERTPEMLSTPFYDSICARTEELRALLGEPTIEQD